MAEIYRLPYVHVGMSTTYRYVCSLEQVHVFETLAASASAPTVCKNDAAAFVAGTLTVIKEAESHTDLADIGTYTHSQLDSHVNNAAIHEIITASNLTGDQGLFSAKVGGDLRFKSLSQGTNVTLTSSANAVTIDGLNIIALPTDAMPDAAADFFVTYDTSAAAHRKVLLSAMPYEPTRFIFHAYDAAGCISINDGFTPITWDTEVRKDSVYVHANNASAITINRTGYVVIVADICIDATTGTSRTASLARLMINTGAGFVELSGSRTAMYHRQSTQGATAGSITRLVNITSGTQIRLEAQRTSGTSFLGTLPHGCRITISTIQ